MAEFAFVHRPVSNPKDSNDHEDRKERFEELPSSLLVWKTCRRQILFLDSETETGFRCRASDEIFKDADAEIFLAEILCGLHSPLIGETEVLGQFKSWWKELPADSHWKRQNLQRMEHLFFIVKTVREKILSGYRSSNYGSILRRYLQAGCKVDLLGAGNLAENLIPWVQKNPYRIWCRQPQSIGFDHQALETLQFSQISPLHSVVVIAAPLTHSELEPWLLERGFSSEHVLLDLRRDSDEFELKIKPKTHVTLNGFFSLAETSRQEAQEIRERSKSMILKWSEERQSKSQIRPFGWDDL